jgi:hypothetical protein
MQRTPENTKSIHFSRLVWKNEEVQESNYEFKHLSKCKIQCPAISAFYMKSSIHT